MADENSTPPSDNPKDLRAQLEQAIALNKQLTERVNAYESDQKLQDSGFAHLTARQRRTLLRELKDEEKELTPENVKSIAQELGFPVEPPKAPTQETTPPPANNGDQQQAPEGDPQVDESLSGFDVIANAQRAAVAGKMDPSLIQKMKDAKSPEELTALIRKEGAGSGIVHSWDA